MAAGVVKVIITDEDRNQRAECTVKLVDGRLPIAEINEHCKIVGGLFYWDRVLVTYDYRTKLSTRKFADDVGKVRLIGTVGGIGYITQFVQFAVSKLWPGRPKQL